MNLNVKYGDGRTETYTLPPISMPLDLFRETFLDNEFHSKSGRFDEVLDFFQEWTPIPAVQLKNGRTLFQFQRGRVREAKAILRNFFTAER